MPAPVALAATWDPRRAELIGSLLAAECRRKNVDVLLAPTVNLQRSPSGGRNFEFLGEDPLLTGEIGAALVRGLQGGGVAATVKHFVANDSETERFTVDNRLDERVLRELYLAPFEFIVAQARPWAVMAAYNGVNGDTMTESPMLNEILKGEWGFDGLVMSDWHAARTIRPPGPASTWRCPGRPDHGVPPSPTRCGGGWSPRRRSMTRCSGCSGWRHASVRWKRLSSHAGAVAWTGERAREMLRSTTAAGFVLARNEHSLLPLDRRSLRRVAVIGPNAATPRTLGGGSATVFPAYRVSPLDGLTAALAPEVTIDYSPGVRSHTRIPLARPALLYLPGGAEPGALVEFVAESGTVLHTEHRLGGFYIWRGLPETAGAVPFAAIRVTTTLQAPAAGTYLIGCSGHGRFRLTLAGELAFDRYLRVPDGTDPTEGYSRPPQHSAVVSLHAGQSIDVVLEYRTGGLGDQTSFVLGGVSFQLNIEEPYLPDEQEIARAVRLAEAADAAVVVVGTTEETESEGFDRACLELPGRQDELVRRIAEANPRTVVVVNTGSPVLLPWAETVPAVLLTLFPGQEYGNALADVLLGHCEPGGRLPVTWPESADGLPATKPDDGVLAYSEGLHIGYRHFDRTGREPRYPFGHGMGYTRWEYLAAERRAADEDGILLRVRLRNGGAKHGCETIQVYASRPDSAVERPARWLAGFAKVEAGPGAEVTADIPIPLPRLAHWDITERSWTIEPGDYLLSIGRSSRDLPMAVTVTISPATDAQE